MLIRNEQTVDFDEIYNLVKEAFEASEHCDGDEQDFVLRLRASNNYLPPLAFVAEDSGKLVGHIMLTKTCIETIGEKIDALLLAPLAVLLNYRRKGIGAALVNKALSMAKEAGHKAVFLCGDPAYYGRFGFKRVVEFGIKYTMDVPEQYVLGCELYADALKNISGTINIV